MRTSIFNNSLNDREKLYFSILRTVNEFKGGSSQSFELNGMHHISHL